MPAPCTHAAGRTDPLVIAKGPAGTGKTLLSVACGLDGTYDDHTGRRYNEMLLTRSNVQADNDLGALPGDLQDKMSPLVRPFYDNMERIFCGRRQRHYYGKTAD